MPGRLPGPLHPFAATHCWRRACGRPARSAMLQRYIDLPASDADRSARTCAQAELSRLRSMPGSALLHILWGNPKRPNELGCEAAVVPGKISVGNPGRRECSVLLIGTRRQGTGKDTQAVACSARRPAHEACWKFVVVHQRACGERHPLLPDSLPSGIPETSTHADRPVARTASPLRKSNAPSARATISSSCPSGGGTRNVISALAPIWLASSPQTYPPCPEFAGPQKRLSIVMDGMDRFLSRSRRYLILRTILPCTVRSATARIACLTSSRGRDPIDVGANLAFGEPFHQRLVHACGRFGEFVRPRRSKKSDDGVSSSATAGSSVVKGSGRW